VKSPLPAAVREHVERALERASGRPRRVSGARPVGGGCVNRALRLEVEDGESFFLKFNADAPAGMFEAEADGLSALADGHGALRVPAVLATGSSWLLLELVPEGRPGPRYAERLGRGLAELHATATGRGTFGWSRVIPSTSPAANPPGRFVATVAALW